MSQCQDHGWAAEWKVDLEILRFNFSTKPLLIGGKAMEYYGYRQAGADIDLVITNEDYLRLAAQYPNHRRDLWGDLGVCIHGFEIWRSIALYDYAFLAEGAIEEDNCRIISEEKLLFTRLMARKVEKYSRDLDMMVERIHYQTLPWRLQYLASGSLEELAQASEVIGVGEVLEQETSQYNATVFTLSTVQITELWKGTVEGNRVKVFQTGGQLDKRITEPLQAAPLMQIGERYLLFMEHAKGDDFFVIKGIRQGMALLKGEQLEHTSPVDAVGITLNGARLEQIHGLIAPLFPDH